MCLCALFFSCFVIFFFWHCVPGFVSFFYSTFYVCVCVWKNRKKLFRPSHSNRCSSIINSFDFNPFNLITPFHAFSFNVNSFFLRQLVSCALPWLCGCGWRFFFSRQMNMYYVWMRTAWLCCCDNNLGCPTENASHTNLNSNKTIFYIHRHVTNKHLLLNA